MFQKGEEREERERRNTQYLYVIYIYIYIYIDSSYTKFSSIPACYGDQYCFFYRHCTSRKKGMCVCVYNWFGDNGTPNGAPLNPLLLLPTEPPIKHPKFPFISEAMKKDVRSLAEKYCSGDLLEIQTTREIPTVLNLLCCVFFSPPYSEETRTQIDT